MYDVRLALADMARQLRSCRARDGLTLQQLATRCGVAASTIHKIEAQQMVPTVSVLLKVARGLGRRPEELVRDRHHDIGEPHIEASGPATVGGDPDEARPAEPGAGAWRIDHARGERFHSIPLEPGQRAVLVVERGQGELVSHRRRVSLGRGDLLELQEESFTLKSAPGHPLSAILIVSPAGSLAELLGPASVSPWPDPRLDPRPGLQPDRTPTARDSAL